MNPAWSEILLSLASPLCLSEKSGCTSAKGLKERDTSVTELPRNKSGEGAACRPGRREDAVGLRCRKAGESALGGKVARWQDKCHPLSVWRIGYLAEKEKGRDE